MICGLLASFSQSMSPWRAKATSFRTKFPTENNNTFCVSMYSGNQTVFVLLWWILGRGIPVYKEAHRMPLSINQGAWGVYLLPLIQFHMISPSKLAFFGEGFRWGYVCRPPIPHYGSGLEPPPQQWGAAPHCCGIHNGGWEGGRKSHTSNPR